MLSNKQIADLLQNELNKEELYHFTVTDINQNWYNYGIKTRDNTYYAPCVVRTSYMPTVSSFLDTRRIDVVIGIKGLNKDRELIENIINGLQERKVDGFLWKFTTLQVDNIEANKLDGQVVQEFIGSFRISIIIPFQLMGSDVIVKIGDVEVECSFSSGVYDKALIPNVDFNQNISSDINTGEEITLSFPVYNNAKVIELFGAVLSRKYNQKFTFTFDYIVASVTQDLVLRRGVINHQNNENGLTFQATFTRALERQEITINGEAVATLGFTPQMSVTPEVLEHQTRNIIGVDSYSKTISMTLENDGSDLVNDIIEQHASPTGKKYEVRYKINGKEFSDDYMITNIMVPTSENPSAIITVTMGVGRFD